MRKLFAAALAAAVSLPLSGGAGEAQPYPSKPIKWVISFGPGSASDALARIAGNELGQALGQPVVIIHKPGADGAISGVEVKRSAPDGYTFLFGTNSALAVVPNMRKEPPYDVMTDFTPVTYLGDNTFFLVTHPSVPAKSIAELITYAKANPKKLNYAAGNTYALVGGSMFSRQNGIEMQAIPYKSEPDAIVDLISGQVQVMLSTTTTAGPLSKDGKIKVLATTFKDRSPVMPDIPSFPESGQPAMPIAAWFALLGPAGLPADIVARVNKEMVRVLALPNVKEAMNKQGFIPRSSTPEELSTWMKDQLGHWKKALSDAGMEPQ